MRPLQEWRIVMTSTHKCTETGDHVRYIRMCMLSRVMIWDMSCHTGSDTYTLTGAANGTQAVMCLCCSLSPTHTHTRKTVEASLYVGISVQGSPLHTHTHTYTHTSSYAHTHAHMLARTYAHAHTCMLAHTYVHTCKEVRYEMLPGGSGHCTHVGPLEVHV